MSQSLEAFHERLRQRFGDRLSATNVAMNQVTIEVPVQQLIEVCTALRDEPEFRFEQLLDLCGMDYSGYGQAEWETDDTTSTGFSRGVSAGAYRESRVMSARFASVCQLLSVTHNRRLRVRCFAPDEPPRIPSVVDIWASANWYEREAFDLFVILF